MEITLTQAKNIILNTQLLSGHAAVPGSGAAVTDGIIDTLGYVQIDTINIINRTHLHTLWVRQPDFREDYLHDLQSKSRRVFEYWGHAMSYLPLSDYRYYLPRMKNYYKPTSPWGRYQHDKVKNELQPVLDRIRTEGPLSAADFKDSRKQGGSWWDWKPAKLALELLFRRGDLMVTERRNFNKIYDLTERVLPADVDTRMPDKPELARFFVRRALAALGVANVNEINRFLQPHAARDSDLRTIDKAEIVQTVNELVEVGEASKIKITGVGGQQDYILSSNLASIGQMAQYERLFLLSPFDNLIIQRARTRRLFGFDYTLECYLPEKKRTYGYFVLPILWGDGFAGRFDAKADRAEKVFWVQSLFFEPEFRDFDAFLPVFVEKLKALAQFNGCKRIRIGRVGPEKVEKAVRDFIDA